MESVLDLAVTQQTRDMELVRQALIGDTTAFDMLFECHRKFVYNVCFRMLGSVDDAVDASQAAFVQAYRDLAKFRGDAEFRTWMYRIAVNVCTDQIRREKRRRMLSYKIETPEGNPASGDAVWEAILELPPDLRAVLVLHYFQELTCAEMSVALNCTESAARVRLHRARQAFKKKYKGA
ncbi:MAG: RNA polymerase sigma factor [Armatimonadota bacterium]